MADRVIFHCDLNCFFASVELLVHQAEDQPAGPKISIVVPLYNTPLDFLDEMLDSVVNQTYKNWELLSLIHI